MKRPLTTAMVDARVVRRLVLALATAVAAPTACVLWFMAHAVRNEQFAVRQRLADWYQTAVAGEWSGQVEAQWRARQEALEAAVDAAGEGGGAGEIFAAIMGRSDLWSGVVVLDEAGRVAYPAGVGMEGVSRGASPAWAQAWRLEFTAQDYEAAARLYGELAQSGDGTAASSAQAWLAQARCLAKAGDPTGAALVCVEILGGARFAGVRDEMGNLVALTARARAVELLVESDRQQAGVLAAELADRACDYGGEQLTSAQRVFLLEKARELLATLSVAAAGQTERLGHWLAVEELSREAASLIEQGGAGLAGGGLGVLDGRYYVVATRRTAMTVAGVLTKEKTAEEFAAATARSGLGDGEEAVVTDGRGQEVWASRPAGAPSPAEGQAGARGEAFAIFGAGVLPAGWRCAIYLRNDNAISTAARRQITLYVWTGLLVIVVLSGAAAWAGRIIRRQVAVNRLKNDFIATVTHELKTPLASMRVLVDTLREGRYRDQQQVQEYLDLMARESARLSRLIDNFLTFSRMERNKYALEMAEASAAAVVADAAEAVRAKYAQRGCQLETDVPADLPNVLADHDALVTVLVNLLDNACKYSADDRRVRLRAYRQGEHLCWAVSDQGIGMTRRVQRRIFERFYQADQRLTRPAEGCGLGLSIVKFIVQAHHGRITVQSRPGQGSTFTVQLPLGSREDREPPGNGDDRAR